METDRSLLGASEGWPSWTDITDSGLGLVDASIVTVAENLNTVTIATLNRRDFSVVRSRVGAAFELVPKKLGTRVFYPAEPGGHAGPDRFEERAPP